MPKKLDKQTRENQKFYENFLKFTVYTLVIIFIILALMTIFLV